MDLGLKGKVSIVVGGAGNLGTAISKCLAQEGAKVVISYGKQRRQGGGRQSGN